MGAPSNWLLCPFDIFPSISEDFFAFQHKILQGHHKLFCSNPIISHLSKLGIPFRKKSYLEAKTLARDVLIATEAWLLPGTLSLSTDRAEKCMYVRVYINTHARACTLHLHHFCIGQYFLKSMSSHQYFWFQSTITGFTLICSLSVSVTPVSNSESFWFPFSFPYSCDQSSGGALVSSLRLINHTSSTLREGCLSIPGLWHLWPGHLLCSLST